MNEHDGPVYEVTLSVDREIAHDIDDWLAGHVDRMLDVPGIVGARNYALEDDEDGRVRRVTCYLFESDAHLQHYLENQASDLRQHTQDRFGDRFTASRRILRHPASGDGAQTAIQHCLNCDAILAGQYCGSCGQRATSRLISVWELVRDAFGDLFELDSRLWRTLIPLAVRPGRLTRDYLRGRRARFMPPFRMYIVMSLLFFLLAFFDPRDDFGILFVPEPTAGEQTENGDAATEARNELLSDDVREELANEGIVVNGSDTGGGLSIAIDGEDLDADCRFDDYDPSKLPEWMARRLTRERLEAACRRSFLAGEEGVRGVFDDMIENVPVGLFVLLPVMALVLKALYPLSRRYYVEHLLFVVHYHSFIFLALSVQILFSRLAATIGLPAALDELVTAIITLYVPVYLYRSLRRVYGQGRVVTLLKLAVLLVAYTTGLVVIIILSAVFAAFSA